jgi:Uncharacterized protein conserved in bacteria (DUF2255)
MTKEVIFEPVDGPINDWIDDAYRAKYHDSPYLSPMISARARSATVKVTRGPRIRAGLAESGRICGSGDPKDRSEANSGELGRKLI